MNRYSIANSREGRRRCAPGCAALLLAAALLAGCGQKGPLWVPGHAKNTPWPMKPAGDAAAPVAPAAEPPGATKDDAAKPARDAQ